MTNFHRSNIPKLHRTFTRDILSRQVFKICFSCSKPFNRKKGRIKAHMVDNLPCRYVCNQCLNSLANGKANDRVRLVDV